MDQDAAKFASDPGPSDLPAYLRFEVLPYQADGGFTPFGLLLTVLFNLAGCVVAAWGASYVYDWGGCGCSLIGWVLFFAVFTVLAVGGGVLGVHLGKVRSPHVAAVIGALGGPAFTIAFIWCRFQGYLQHLAEKHPQQHAQLLARGFGLLEYVETVWGFWDFLAAAVFLVVIGAGGFLFLWGAASVPFCPACNTWKENRVLGELRLPSAWVTDVLRRGEIVKFAGAGPPHQDRLRLTLSACPNCAADAAVDVKLESLTTNPKGEEEAHELVQLTYPGQALRVLETLFPAPLPEAEEEEE